MSDVSNVSTGKPKVAGAVYRAPKGTALPTDAASTLSSAWASMGYISEDGVTNSNSPDTDKIKAWGGQVVLVVTNEKSDSFQITFLESLNPAVLETVYGSANVTVDALNGTISVVGNNAEPDEFSYVIDMAMRGGALKRVVIPDGQLSDLADIVYKDDEAVGYGVTLECLPDNSGNQHYEYIKLAAGASFDLAIDKSTLSVAHGSTSQITATTTPVGMKVAWGTSDATKATVDQTGLVTGVAAGSATITAIFGGIVKTCSVTVT